MTNTLATWHHDVMAPIVAGLSVVVVVHPYAVAVSCLIKGLTLGDLVVDAFEHVVLMVVGKVRCHVISS